MIVMLMLHAFNVEVHAPYKLEDFYSENVLTEVSTRLKEVQTVSCYNQKWHPYLLMPYQRE